MTAAVKILIAAGGTGGHVFPGLAIADALRAAGAAAVWLGSGGMETALVQKKPLPLHTVRYRAPRRWWHLPLLAPAVFRAWRVLKAEAPAAVLCMGGYASVPAGLAARLAGLPLIVHEQNAVTGRANRLLSRFAAAVLTGFPGGGRQQHVGNPVRAAFFDAGKRRAAPPRTMQSVAVLGGSQGAQALNAIVPEALALLAAAGRRLQITHQCGRGGGDALSAHYQRLQLTADVHEFIDDVAAVMAAADLVICRAGAATLAELAAVGAGAVLVPYPHAAADHQAANARRFGDCGAAIVCPQQTLTPESLAAALTDADCAALGKQAAALAMPAAAETVAARCLEEARRAA